MSQVKFIQGNLACVEGAIKAGMRFFAGYPITPSTEIAEAASELLPLVNGKFIQMEDEIASMGAVIGASLTGVKSMTATSGPGFSLKQENIGYASFAEIPCVIVNIMRGGPSTGLPTLPSQSDIMQSRWGTHGDHPIIVLVPSSVAEMFSLTVTAFNLSEKFRVPVILASDEVIAHMREKIEIPDEVEVINRKKPSGPPGEYKPYKADDDLIPPLASFGEGYHFNITGLTHNEEGFPTIRPQEIQKLQQRLYDKIYKHLDELLEVEEYFIEDAESIIFAYGSSARAALSAVRTAREGGIKAGLLRPKIIWPFPDMVIDKIASKVRNIIVVEMNMGQILLEIERCVHGKCEVFSYLQVNGELITPESILQKIKEVNK